MDAGRLQNAIAAVCPVETTQVIDASDRLTWSFIPGASATQPQIDAGNNIIATIPVQVQNVVKWGEFIRRWLPAEYLALLRARNTAITAGTITLVRQWDIASGDGVVDLNRQESTDFKAALVAASILTQGRANTIFG